MGCEHEKNEWMKCPDCASKATEEAFNTKDKELKEEAKEQSKQISERNKRLKGIL